MAWKKVGMNNAVDIKKEKGKIYEGVYQGRTDIQTKIGPQIIWNFVDDDGLPFSVYGFSNLNRTMESLKPETQCRLSYLGTQNVKTKYGMKDVHQVLVEVFADEEQEQAAEVPF